MKRITIGSIIIKARENKKITRAQLAKKLKISDFYIGHLERNDPVTLSDSMIDRLKKVLGPRLGALKKLQDRHNARVRRVRKAYPSGR